MKKAIFAALLSLTLFSGGTSFWLAAQPNLSAARIRLLETTLKIWFVSTQATLNLCNKENLPDSAQNQKKGSR
jgi:hypothetical protein